MKQAIISALTGALTAILICALSVGSGPLPWLVGKVLPYAAASQNQLSSPTTGTVSGLQLTNNFNNALDSVNTMNSGTSAPTNQLSGVPSQFNRWCNTTANPYACSIYDGAQWLAPYYVDATNHLILNQVGGGTATIASATTTGICADPQYFITISGTTSITGLGTGCFAGQAKKITFSGALTLTYNATSLIVPTAANIITSAGDTADVVYLGSGDWQVTNYQPFSGQALLNPAIDVGDYVMTSLTAPPSAKYLFAYGQTVSRSTYATLLSGITITQSVTATNGSPTLTGFSDTTQIATGAKVEAAFLPSSPVPTVVSCTSTTCLLSGNATASTSGNVTVFPYGDGDGSTTFTMPDCRGQTFAGRDNMGGSAKGALTSTYFGTNPDALGATGGAQNRTLAQANLGTNWSFPVSGTGSIGNLTLCSAQGCYLNSSDAGNIAFVGSNTGSTVGWFSSAPTITMGGNASSNGSGTPVATIQPTLTANCMMRVLAMRTPLPLDRGPHAINDNQLAAIEPQRLAA